MSTTEHHDGTDHEHSRAPGHGAGRTHDQEHGQEHGQEHSHGHGQEQHHEQHHEQHQEHGEQQDHDDDIGHAHGVGHGHGHGAHPDHDEVFDREFWEDKYRTSDPAALRHAPNPYLLDVAETLTPGRVLDAGCGPGAEAIWLARRGWEVTALDISSVALDHARALAAEEGPDVAGRITWQQADLTAWTAPAEGYDLVCTNYVHALEDVVPQLAAAVRPGGTLLVVDHFDILAVLDPAEWRAIPLVASSRVVAAFDGTERVLDDRVMAAVRIAPATT